MRIGKPLLTETADYPALVQAMEQDGVIRKSAEKAYLLMGHGTPHIINQAYPAFDYWLKRSGFDNVFVYYLKFNWNCFSPGSHNVSARLTESAWIANYAHIQLNYLSLLFEIN